MTLLQCLEHFRKSKYYEPLKGLELLYDKLIKEMIDKGEDGNYIDNFIAYLNNYEIMYSQKKSKIKSKSNEINDENESQSFELICLSSLKKLDLINLFLSSLLIIIEFI